MSAERAWQRRVEVRTLGQDKEQHSDRGSANGGDQIDHVVVDDLVSSERNRRIPAVSTILRNLVADPTLVDSLNCCADDTVDGTSGEARYHRGSDETA